MLACDVSVNEHSPHHQFAVLYVFVYPGPGRFSKPLQYGLNFGMSMIQPYTGFVLFQVLVSVGWLPTFFKANNSCSRAWHDRFLAQAKLVKKQHRYGKVREVMETFGELPASKFMQVCVSVCSCDTSQAQVSMLPQDASLLEGERGGDLAKAKAEEARLGCSNRSLSSKSAPNLDSSIVLCLQLRTAACRQLSADCLAWRMKTGACAA